MHRLFLLALLLLAVALAPRPALADAADVDAAARGVVRVVIVDRHDGSNFPVSHGTGFAVGAERIVTNAHVVAEALDNPDYAIGIVPADGDKAVFARLVAVSERNDLALLATTEALNLPPLTIAGNPVQSGAVTAIGYPYNVDLAQGLQSNDMLRAQPPVTATGFLSGRRPSRDFDTLLHTAPIARGNSGGPLVDGCGRVLGVNSFGAESQGTDAEFFFAVSTRELLPFLNANDVTPRLNSTQCRSLAEIDAEEQARLDEEQSAIRARAAADAEALAARTAELRRDVTYETFESRSNHAMLAMVLLLVATGAGGVAALAHREANYRLRAIGGGIALAGLLGALAAWVTQPRFASIDTRVEEALRAEAEEPDTGAIPPSAASTSGNLSCVLDTDRSRVTGAPAQDMVLEWGENGCVNARTQYGQASGVWTRVFVPSSEAAVSVNSFDPAEGIFTMERYLLGREGMTAARAARGKYSAPSCGADAEAVRALGSAQTAITNALPDLPNERLVYRCRPAGQEG